MKTPYFYYADDLVIIAQRKRSNEVITEEEVLNKHNLIQNGYKTKLERLGALKIQAEEIQLSVKVKYLGVIADHTVTWNRHQNLVVYVHKFKGVLISI